MTTRQISWTALAVPTTILALVSGPVAPAHAATPGVAPPAAVTSPAGAVTATAVRPMAGGSVTVTVRLKKSWRVTKAAKLKIKDGALTCKVVKLAPKAPKPATKATLRCTVPASLTAATSVRIVVIVKGVPGAKVTTTASVEGTPTTTPTTNPTPTTPTTPTETPTAPTIPSTPATPTTSAGAIARVNSDSAGNGGNLEAGSPTWSPDGTRVAFISAATNLVPGVTDGCAHVYVKTLASGAIAAVDRAADGTLGDCMPTIHGGLAFSPDSQWLLFCSSSAAIFPSIPAARLFGKNLATGAVEWFGYECSRPAWSPDGNWIAYETDVDCPGWENNGASDVFVIDRNSADPLLCGEIYRASTDSSGNQQVNSGGPMDSIRPQFSPDSTKILFESDSKFLVHNDTNVASDVFVKDLTNGTTTRASTGSTGAQGSGSSERGAWAPDSTRVMFQSKANDFVAGDTNVHEDIFVKDLSNGALTMVSTRSDGSPALFQHYTPSWFPSGAKIAWSSEAVDLVPLDINIRRDVFVKDLSTGFVQLVSSNASGLEGDNASSTWGSAPVAVSPDGTRVLFTSSAQNLAPGDNNAFNEDVFVKTVS